REICGRRPSGAQRGICSQVTPTETYDRLTLREKTDRDHRRIDGRLDRDHVGQRTQDSDLEESKAARGDAGRRTAADADDGARRTGGTSVARAGHSSGR